MKTFKEYLAEESKKPKEEKPVEFFATLPHRIGDSKHDIENMEDTEEEPTEFFAHFKSEKDKKHSVDEGFEDSYQKELQIFKDNKAAVSHHSRIRDSGAHNSSVTGYTQSSSYINQMLIRKGKLKKQEERDVKHIDEVTNHPKNALTKPVSAYSGIGREFHKKLSKVEPGKSVTSRAYISTTIIKSKASLFGSGNYIHFHLPKGYSKGRHIASRSWHPNEQEFLLARGQKFKYLKRNTIKLHGSTIHHLEPILEEKKATTKLSKIKTKIKKKTKSMSK